MVSQHRRRRVSSKIVVPNIDYSVLKSLKSELKKKTGNLKERAMLWGQILSNNADTISVVNKTMCVKQIFRWIWPTSVGISSLLLHVPPFIPPSSCSCVTLLSRISDRFSLASLHLLTRAISSLHQKYFQRNADHSTFSVTILWIKERKDQNEYHGKGFYVNQAI